jgi:hypothetical protein
VPQLSVPKSFDYMVTSVIRKAVQVIFTKPLEEGLIKYFKARMLLRAQELLEIEENICNRIILK